MFEEEGIAVVVLKSIESRIEIVVSARASVIARRLVYGDVPRVRRGASVRAVVGDAVRTRDAIQ